MGITWPQGSHPAQGAHSMSCGSGKVFPSGLFPDLGSWAGSFQEAGMGKSRADLLRLPQGAEIRAAEIQPEGSVDKTAQEARCQ